jgi:hypothetical protein
MSASVERCSALRVGSWLPREHGFWAMLLAVLGSALLRSPRAASFAAAVVVLVASIAAAALIRRAIRRHALAQLAAALTLGTAGLPVDLVAGDELGTAFGRAALWSGVFCASALVVRAAFCRSAGHARRAFLLTGLAVALCAVTAAGFGAAGAAALAMAAGLAATTCAAFALLRPSVKQLKPVGLALAALAAAVGLILV